MNQACSQTWSFLGLSHELPCTTFVGAQQDERLQLKEAKTKSVGWFFFPFFKSTLPGVAQPGCLDCCRDRELETRNSSGQLLLLPALIY